MPTLIALMGHSEGGIIAPMVAARDKDVAFIVMMAGTGVRFAAHPFAAAQLSPHDTLTSSGTSSSAAFRMMSITSGPTVST